ncbi:hypothetical protein FQR65_LT04897 [Abscondita terminalis]|nr:hypothetical protein FQR65_LT04897 [Abscondita terminalis]
MLHRATASDHTMGYDEASTFSDAKRRQLTSNLSLIAGHPSFHSYRGFGITKICQIVIFHTGQLGSGTFELDTNDNSTITTKG